jgi:UDP-GlcNAc:undecaprenyl-phosphate/decaprenyl-phosphate GlcNAc-1-phosphate transferase
MLTVNALNWFDGIPGQVSTTSTIGFTLLGCLAYFRNDQPEIALLAFMLAAIALACVLFDFPPPKVLMGDSGSMFFGFMLGLLGVYQGGKVATAFVALGIPLIDAGFVVLRRMSKGKSPFKGDQEHLHHRLLAMGLGKRTIVLMMATISAALGISALFLDTAGKAVQGALLIGIVGIMTVLSAPRRVQGNR